MLRSLLADRFKLAIHEEAKPVPAFVLTAEKTATEKVDPAGASNNPGCQYQAQQPSTYIMYSCLRMTMDAFAKELRGMAGDYLHNPVIDSTGLDGAWDFDLKWNARSQSLPEGTERITIFNALEKQLGLHRSLKTTPLPALVVDRVNEKPADNRRIEQLVTRRASWRTIRGT